MFLATLVCWAAFTIVLSNINPFEAGWGGFVLFYSSLFLSVAGTFTISGIFVRLSVLKRTEYISRKVFVSFRQSLMLSFVLILTLFLVSHGLLRWWNIAALVIGLSLLEFMLVSSKRIR